MYSAQVKSSTSTNYEDYSSGRVIYSASGATNFPVRLSNQIFEKCVEYLKSKNNYGPYKVYDPFCGFAYTLTVIGFMHPSNVEALYASDVDKKSLEFAGKNLALLSSTGIDRRIAELEYLINTFDKDSHRAALASAHKLKSQIATSNIEISSFHSDALAQATPPEFIHNIDIVIADLPYGRLTEWNDITEQNNSQTFLNNIRSCLASTSIIAITSDKKQIIDHQGYERIKKFNTGKRKTILLQKI